MRVLITVPHLNSKGGVANYYRTIRKYFSVDVDFFEVGANKWEEKTGFERLKQLVIDPLRFRRLMIHGRKHYDLIHLNPSFNYGSLIRDGILLKIARDCGKKTIVFFRGFNMDNAMIVDKYLQKAFFINYCKVNSFALLASEFEDQLRTWGFTQPIFLETTLVDDEFAKGFSIEDRVERIGNGKSVNLLFLARIVKEKGVIETLGAFKLLMEKYSNLFLTMAGDGPFLRQTIQFAKSMGIDQRILFPGFVAGEAKNQIMTNSDIYIFPSYTEGMPNSVLEAMAFGMPVVATPVGGIKDILKDGENGFLLRHNTPASIADSVMRIIEDKGLQKTMSINCYQSRPRYLASNVARRLEAIYEKVIRQ